MKKYLREIETAGIVLLFLGVVTARAANMTLGTIMTGAGLALWLLTVIVKATDWNTYRRDNIVNICIMLGAIVSIFITYMFIIK